MRIAKYILILILTVTSISFIVQVVNPHSFMTTTTAIVLAIILFIFSIFFILYIKQYNSNFLLYGSLLVMMFSLAYMWYGIKSYCQNAYYELTKNSVNMEYNCFNIILNSK